MYESSVGHALAEACRVQSLLSLGKLLCICQCERRLPASGSVHFWVYFMHKVAEFSARRRTPVPAGE